MKRTIALLLVTLILCHGVRAQDVLGDGELKRAQLFGLISEIPSDPEAMVSPRMGLTMVADALALSLGARDGVFDNVALTAPEEGALLLREFCMALGRAGDRMGVPVGEDLSVPQAFSGAIGRSAYFSTKDAPYLARNGKQYENELLYCVAFCCGTPSVTTGLTLVDARFLIESGLDAPLSWQVAVAGALRLFEALPLRTGEPNPEDPADPESNPAAKFTWIEVQKPLVNVREEASLDALILTQASQGERYRSYGLTNEGWYIIEYDEGCIGYISAEYCMPVDHREAAEGESIGTVTVLANASYVRASPGNSGRRIYTASQGQSFECLGEEGNGWYRIRLKTGEVGYIYHKNCALTWFD